jgi:alkanesulfonate monooxygenase SsuD/methylene tetrahydromethanopterin reductase-like flavin-dependent oxidoreductase (luciferase family)
VFDPLETLSYVAANTNKIALGTSVIDMLFHNPVILARRFATLDVLSEGRTICGLGIGWSKDEYQVSNIPFKERGKRADEFIQALKRIWTDVVCSIISKSVYTSLVRRLDTRRTEIYYLVISKIVII